MDDKIQLDSIAALADLHCHRTACQAEINPKRDHYRIWNELSTAQPNTYCVKCGRKIIEHNQHDTIQLKYQIVRPDNA